MDFPKIGGFSPPIQSPYNAPPPNVSQSAMPLAAPAKAPGKPSPPLGPAPTTPAAPVGPAPKSAPAAGAPAGGNKVSLPAGSLSYTPTVAATGSSRGTSANGKNGGTGAAANWGKYPFIRNMPNSGTYAPSRFFTRAGKEVEECEALSNLLSAADITHKVLFWPVPGESLRLGTPHGIYLLPEGEKKFLKQSGVIYDWRGLEDAAFDVDRFELHEGESGHPGGPPLQVELLRYAGDPNWMEELKKRLTALKIDYADVAPTVEIHGRGNFLRVAAYGGQFEGSRELLDKQGLYYEISRHTIDGNHRKRPVANPSADPYAAYRGFSR